MAVAIETAGQALSSMTTMIMYPGETVFGKTVSNLHEDIVVRGSLISGTLKYVSGWTQFSPITAYQSGNYLAMKVLASNFDRIIAALIKRDGTNTTVELDSSKQMVFRITDPKSEMIKITGFKDGDIQQITYDLSGLTLNAS